MDKFIEQLVSKSEHQKGFAILETLITFIVLGVGLLVLLNFNSTAMMSSGDAKMRTEAMEVAQRKIQELRSYSYLEDVDDTLPDEEEWDNRMVNGNDTINGTSATFARQWTIDVATDESLAVIDVTVTWNDQNGDGQTLTLNSGVYKVDPTAAAYVLNKAIASNYDPDLGDGEVGANEPEFEYPPGEDPAAVEGPFSITDPDTGETKSYQWKITIGGDIDKKNTQTVELPDPQVSTNYAAICDFGSNAAFVGAQKPIALKSGESLLMTAFIVVDPNGISVVASYDATTGLATAGYVTIDSEGTVTLDQNASEFLGETYTLTYTIVKGSVQTIKVTTFNVVEFDGYFTCDAYFNDRDDIDGDGEYGWTGSLDFAVSGSGGPVFCFPIADPNAFGKTAFTKHYEKVITNQSLFIQVASGINGCAAQL
jgi:type II secretory pathway pseudopilin PulG